MKSAAKSHASSSMPRKSHSFVQASDLTNHETLPRRLHHRFAHFLEGVDFENPLDLGQQTVQQPKVAAGDADDDRNCFLGPTASVGEGFRFCYPPLPGFAWRTQIAGKTLRQIIGKVTVRICFKSQSPADL